jgi:chemotaxis protein methyltransferase CheR
VNRTLTAEDFAQLREYLRATAGLEFDEGRRAGLAAIMHERLSITGQPDVVHYLDWVARPESGPERQRLLDAVTIQETHFHRARPQIEALRQQILPDILERAARERRDAVVWSAGCSTGEEPFTLAMLMLEVAARMPSPPRMRVIGTDVSTAALQVALAATYSGRTIDLAEPAAVSRWLVRESDGTYIVKDDVRLLVQFRHQNLVTDPPPFDPASIDLVVCRHVSIYFSRDTTRALVGRFRDVLSREGWLLMGPAESLWQVSDSFVLEAVGEAFAYRPAVERAAAHTGPRLLAPARPAAIARPASAVAPAPVPARRAVPPPAVPAQVPALRSAASPVASPVASPAPVGKATVEAAQAAFDNGSYDQAAELAQEVLGADPVSSEAYLLLGHARLNKGDNIGAVEPLQRAVYLDPLAGHAHFLLAVALSSIGRTRQAAPSYRAAANTLPGVPPETVRRMLDGRRVQELVQLCRRLADEAEGAPGAAADGASSFRRGA